MGFLNGQLKYFIHSINLYFSCEELTYWIGRLSIVSLIPSSGTLRYTIYFYELKSYDCNSIRFFSIYTYYLRRTKIVVDMYYDMRE